VTSAAATSRSSAEAFFSVCRSPRIAPLAGYTRSASAEATATSATESSPSPSLASSSSSSPLTASGPRLVNQNHDDPAAAPSSARRSAARRSPRRRAPPRASSGATASAGDAVFGRHGLPTTSPEATLTNATALPVLATVTISAPEKVAT
jgi:hypothetical protein